MHYVLSIACLLTFSGTLKTFGSDKTEVPGTLIAIRSFSSLTHNISARVLDSKKEELINQIGEKEFLQMQKYTENPQVPCEMRMYCVKGKDTIKKDLVSLKTRLSQLNFYKIATLTLSNKEGKQEMYCVLRLPYSANKHWDKKIKWETLYFLAKSNSIVDINSVENAAIDPKGKPVKVNVINWGATALFLAENYWSTEKSEQIIRQVGIEEFKQLITFSNRSNIPCQMQSFCEDINGKPKRDKEEYYAAMNRLNIYKIATYTFTNRNGKKFEKCILKVPYNENTSWDQTARWDAVYFIASPEIVEIIESNTGK
jgi:hypothetical protein